MESLVSRYSSRWNTLRRSSPGLILVYDYFREIEILVVWRFQRLGKKVNVENPADICLVHRSKRCVVIIYNDNTIIQSILIIVIYTYIGARRLIIYIVRYGMKSSHLERTDNEPRFKRRCRKHGKSWFIRSKDQYVYKFGHFWTRFESQ